MPSVDFNQSRTNARAHSEKVSRADNETYHFPFKSPREQRIHSTPIPARVIHPSETGRQYAISMAEVMRQYPDQQQDRIMKMTPEQFEAWLDYAKRCTATTNYHRNGFLN